MVSLNVQRALIKSETMYQRRNTHRDRSDSMSEGLSKVWLGARADDALNSTLPL